MAEMADIPQQPPGDPPQPSTNSHDQVSHDQASLLPKDRLQKFFRGFPILSILVGGVLLLAEVVIIVLVLAAPGMVGISDDVALTATQRGVLGGVSIIMLIEAVLFGIVDIGTNRQRARLLKTQRNLLLNQLNKLQSKTEDIDSAKSLVSLERVAELLKQQIFSTESIRRRLNPKNIPDTIEETTDELKMLKEELNHHTLKYVANLIFELATFLWKWALALLVISNNWLSVGVTIAGGVVYPLVVFWQKAIDPTP